MPGEAEESHVSFQTGYPPIFGSLEMIVHCQFQVKLFVTCGNDGSERNVAAPGVQLAD
jgi:hypothetical protein